MHHTFVITPQYIQTYYWLQIVNLNKRSHNLEFGQST